METKTEYFIIMKKGSQNDLITDNKEEAEVTFLETDKNLISQYFKKDYKYNIDNDEWEETNVEIFYGGF